MERERHTSEVETTHKWDIYESVTFYVPAFLSVALIYLDEELDYARTFWDYYAIDFILFGLLMSPFALYALRKCAPYRFGLYFSYLFVAIASVLPLVMAWYPTIAFHHLATGIVQIIQYPQAVPSNASCYLCNLPLIPNSALGSYVDIPPQAGASAFARILWLLFHGQSDPTGNGYEMHWAVIALPMLIYNLYLYRKAIQYAYNKSNSTTVRNDSKENGR